MRTAVKQARLWNPVAQIICISSVIEEYGQGETWVASDDIPTSEAHKRFRLITPLQGFWQWTTERIFVLEDWMRWKGVDECFHLENDNMLYENVSDLLPFLRQGAGLSTTFQGQGSGHDSVRICFSVLYCKSVEALGRLAMYLASTPSRIDEMRLCGLYWLDTPEDCSLLPTAPVGVTLESETYRHWIEDSRIGCIFDSSTYGQFLGGTDPQYRDTGPGFINPDCDFRADQFEYTWAYDAGRRYPVIADKGDRPWKIVNLHIHSKRLEDFN